MSVNLKSYLPRFYDGVYEFEQIIQTENHALNEYLEQLDDAQKNQYIITANATGIAAFEKVFGIVPDLSVEDLEFRRQRLLARSAMRLPFSLGFLREKLDEVIGVDKYQLRIDYDSYEIRIEAVAKNVGWYHEINVLMEKIKPCNMVYVNNPFIEYGVLANETVNAFETVFHYRLGTTWALGREPLGVKNDLGVYKLAETTSIKEHLLENLALYTAQDIDNVLLNGSVEVREFIVKQAEEGVAVVEYDVPGGISEVTNIKLRKGNIVLAESAVYVPVTSLITIKHKIKLTEGV